MKWWGVESRGEAFPYESLLSTPPDKVSFDCSSILASKDSDDRGCRSDFWLYYILGQERIHSDIVNQQTLHYSKVVFKVYFISKEQVTVQ